MALDAIYLDLDGVLCDFAKGVAKLAGVNPAAMNGPVNCHWWGVVDVLSAQHGREWSREEFLQLIDDAGHDFWTGLEKYPWCDDLYELCTSFAPTVIMTSPGRDPSSASGKMQWINENLRDVRRFAITPCKHHMSHPNSLLIDDSTEFCGKFSEHGGEVYLFPQPWSDPENWHTRDRLAEVQALLERMSSRCRIK